MKIVVSVDSGESWKTFNTDHWEDINLTVEDVKSKGISIGIFNLINSTYWNLSSYIDLQISKLVNIWVYGGTWPQPMRARLNIQKYNEVSRLYDADITSEHLIDNGAGGEWHKSIINLSPGKYRFICQIYNGSRTDLEWYLEEVNNNKYLIKQDNMYYSIKDNILTELGTSTDDTQKEEWFNDYGVDDLKEALLTPDENGKKMIDSLGDKFEVRIMVSKG